MNDEAPPTPATTPSTAGLSWRSSRTNRNHVAPKMPHRPASAIWAPTNARRIGSWTDEAEPDPDLGQDRLAVLGLRRWRLLHGPDRPEQQRGRQVGERVDRDRDRGRQQLDEEAADAEGHELRRRAARREGAVRVDQAVPGHDRRQIGVVGGVEEGGQDRPPAPTRRGAAGTPGRRARRRSGTDPSSAARPRSAQIRTGRRRRRSTQAPATRPNTSVAPRSRPRRTATSSAPEPSTRIATRGSAIRVMSDPKIDTVAAAQTRTKDRLRQSGEANGLRMGGSIVSVVDGTSGSAASRNGLRYTRLARCVRTRAPPGTGQRRPGPSPFLESSPGPCSTP